MRSRPNARELLDIAEKTLSAEVMPDISERQRYNLALVASAIGIAKRELAGGVFAWEHELDILRALYGDDVMEQPETMLVRLNRQLADELRAGVYDEKNTEQETVLNLLFQDVVARLNEDNPTYERVKTLSN
ncbi:MAG: hypothetical protein CMI96_05655 [Pelagibacteraceae bacterium]|nr:hypothetical protein [Pelagibacteraceae bacterium]PPR10871.1 MAG: hypothetical protein CFH41_01450 [Alphaproteobacteria bacterium MarineAlpha11_Bin1]|tara:strand:+ start:23881 stop:24276 length:396 start_codon:yes stop_codon:yes gene_type:complete